MIPKNGIDGNNAITISVLARVNKTFTSTYSSMIPFLQEKLYLLKTSNSYEKLHYKFGVKSNTF